MKVVMSCWCLSVEVVLVRFNRVLMPVSVRWKAIHCLGHSANMT